MGAAVAPVVGCAGRPEAGADRAGAAEPGPAEAREDRAASGRPAFPLPAGVGLALPSAATETPAVPVPGLPIIRYPAKPKTITMAARPKTSMYPGRRCHCGRERSSSSSRLVADTGPGARWAWSYSWISGSGSVPTTSAMLRMSPRA